MLPFISFVFIKWVQWIADAVGIVAAILPLDAGFKLVVLTIAVLATFAGDLLMYYIGSLQMAYADPTLLPSRPTWLPDALVRVVRGNLLISFVFAIIVFAALSGILSDPIKSIGLPVAATVTIGLVVYFVYEFVNDWRARLIV